MVLKISMLVSIDFYQISAVFIQLLKINCFSKYCSTMYGSQLWPLWNNNMERICIQWRNALRGIWRLPRNSHTDIVHLVSDKEPVAYLSCNEIY